MQFVIKCCAICLLATKSLSSRIYSKQANLVVFSKRAEQVSKTSDSGYTFAFECRMDIWKEPWWRQPWKDFAAWWRSWWDNVWVSYPASGTALLNLHDANVKIAIKVTDIGNYSRGGFNPGIGYDLPNHQYNLARTASANKVYETEQEAVLSEIATRKAAVAGETLHAQKRRQDISKDNFVYEASMFVEEQVSHFCTAKVAPLGEDKTSLVLMCGEDWMNRMAGGLGSRLSRLCP